MASPTIGEYMTASPHTVGQEQKLSVAHALMRKHRIRHLPVLHGGKLVGVVTLRDLDWIESFKDSDPEQIPVEEAMSSNVYLVSEETPLLEVIGFMHEHNITSALVGTQFEVRGVFTTNDALVPLLEFLKKA
jgi:acetoin utilization protein AcuB